ncbi:hypothetical protein KIN20_030483 [Parelaphostrongylus tenuis]|uniref:Uncharacterized protein n=1 Tax=Parelaphostrongylus tenuis TaxID=148309 RepID=A0AAD5R3T1_PARTN|nr:hypothetical protein KIN20_030483 [Parelaphostrongylus tenuis]
MNNSNSNSNSISNSSSNNNAAEDECNDVKSNISKGLTRRGRVRNVVFRIAVGAISFSSSSNLCEWSLFFAD